MDSNPNDWSPFKNSRLEYTHRGQTLCRHREKMVIDKLRRKASQKSNPDDILILVFYPLEL